MTAYRKHFILLNMVLVGTVLFATMLALGFYLVRSEYVNMRQTMLEVLEPFRGENGSFSYTSGEMKAPPPAEQPEGPAEEARRDAPGEMAPPQADGGGVREDSAARSRCITVFFSNGQGTIVSGSGDVGEENVQAAASAALTQEESFGYLGGCDLFYLVAGRGDSVKLSLFPASYLRRDTLEIAAFLAGAFFLAMIGFYLISRYISRLAVRPVEEAMEREKQFVADASHDLKTPLSVLQACHHILLENPRQTIAEQRQWLDKSGTAMQNMQKLIDDMLTLSAMDTVQRLPEKERVDLSSVVMKATLQMEAMAYDRGIALETALQENLTVLGDAGALLRVASGLIENALKYEPENGRVAVALSAKGHKTVLTVRNTGTIIGEEDLPHVFERFYRGDKTRSARGGHGLGLAIIKRTVELMGGKIEASSSQETGTVFTVTFP